MNDFYTWLLTEAVTKSTGGGSNDSCAEAMRADRIHIGLVWTMCESGDAVGLAMTPQSYSRTLAWPGTLAGKTLGELAAGITDWEPFTAGVALAAINAAAGADWSVFENVTELPQAGGNLAVFEHFLPRLKGARIVVVGRYPGLERYEKDYDLRVLERHPGPNDYPESAAEVLLPEADWVFLTASSIINKTFPRLAELSAKASVVLMGPSTPWLPGLADWGVDYLAGTMVRDAGMLRQTVAEAGGRMIFEKAAQYMVADIGRPRMRRVEQRIAELAGERDRLKQDMDAWYGQGRTTRFPQLAEYEAVLESLSGLDTQYKWMWDARQTPGRVRHAA